MSSISRYIFRQLVLGTVLVSVALAFIVWLTQSLPFLQFVIGKGLDIGTWLKLTTLLLPWFVSVILPAALFFVVLFIYNKLAVDKELVVVQSAGISLFGLAKPAMLTAVAAAIVGYALTLIIVPATFRSFKELQWSIRNDVSQILLREGAFNHLADDLTVYVRERGGEGDLIGILVHDTRESPRSVTLMAERGTIVTTSNEPRILLENGSRQELERGSGDLSVLYFDSYALEFGALSRKTEDRFADNRERSTLELLNASEADGISAINVSRMKAEAHQRLSAPLTAIGYTLMALTILLRGNYDRRGQTGRIVIAILTVVALQAATMGAANLASQAPSYTVLIYAIVLLPIFGGIMLLALPGVKPSRHHISPVESGTA